MSKEREPAPVMVRAPRSNRAHPKDNPWGLTPAEAQVFDLMCEGLIHKQIGVRLGISQKSAEMAARRARFRMGYYGHSIVPYLLWDRWRRNGSQEG